VPSWNGVLEAVQGELKRTAQRVGGRTILASRLSILLPKESFSPWAPVLPQVVEELGQELVAWAERQGFSWYGGRSPVLSVELTEGVEERIVVEFVAP